MSFNQIDDLQYKEKYLKYKGKYKYLKEQHAGTAKIDNWNYFFCFQDFKKSEEETINEKTTLNFLSDIDYKTFSKNVQFRAYELSSFSGKFGLSYPGTRLTNKIPPIPDRYEYDPTKIVSYGNIYDTLLTPWFNITSTNLNNLEIDSALISKLNFQLLETFVLNTYTDALKQYTDALKQYNQEIESRKKVGNTSSPQKPVKPVKPLTRVRTIVTFMNGKIFEVISIKYDDKYKSKDTENEYNTIGIEQIALTNYYGKNKNKEGLKEIKEKWFISISNTLNKKFTDTRKE
jgi:hypothetical protein